MREITLRVEKKKQNQRRDLRRGEEDEEEGTKDEITSCV
jgi:hypothetical protein